MNNVWTTTLVPFYQDQGTPIPWNFCCFQVLLCSGSQHQPTQCKSTIADKNNTIKCCIKEAIAIINIEKPLWIGIRDWTSQPLTILSCGFITTFLWCHLRLHIAKEVQAIQTKYLFFVSNFALGLWILSTIIKFSIIFFSSTFEVGELDREKGGFLICINGSKVSLGWTCGSRALYCFFFFYEFPARINQLFVKNKDGGGWGA